VETYDKPLQRRRRPLLQPFGTGQISPHAALSPPYWVSTNRVGSALPEGKSAAVAATGNTQTGSLSPRATGLFGIAYPLAPRAGVELAARQSGRGHREDVVAGRDAGAHIRIASDGSVRRDA